MIIVDHAAKAQPYVTPRTTAAMHVSIKFTHLSTDGKGQLAFIFIAKKLFLYLPAD